MVELPFEDPFVRKILLWALLVLFAFVVTFVLVFGVGLWFAGPLSS